jgi:hypothetical protein
VFLSQIIVRKKEINLYVVKMVKMVKKIKKHQWDETLVAAVMIVSAIAILILLASYVSVTGQAYSSLPTKSGVIEMLSNADFLSGSGKVKCNIECGKIGKACILARKSSELSSCSAKIDGAYSCLCAIP